MFLLGYNGWKMGALAGVCFTGMILGLCFTDNEASKLAKECIWKIT